MKKYLEYKDEKSSKFWEAETQGLKVIVRYGKIGAKGTTKEKLYPNALKAEAAVQKDIKAKIKKGYIDPQQHFSDASKAEYLKIFKGYLNDWGSIYWQFAGFEDTFAEKDECGCLVMGGDQILKDVRGNQGRYCLNHETWELDLIQEYQKPIERIIDSKMLAYMNFWVMDLFSAWTHRMPKPMGFWKNDETIDAFYEKCKPVFKDDPHIALYWLMHFSLLLDEREQEVRDLLKDTKSTLLLGAMAYLDELGVGGNFTLQQYRADDDTTTFKHRRSEVLFDMYAKKAKSLRQWWYSYYLCENWSYIYKVHSLVENVNAADCWEELLPYFKKYDGIEKLGYHYIQANNPKLSTTERSEHSNQFLKNTLPHIKDWSKIKSHKLAILSVYQQATNFELLAQCADAVWENEPLAEEYLKLKTHLQHKTGVTFDASAEKEKGKQAQDTINALKAESVDYKSIIGALSEQEQETLFQLAFQQKDNIERVVLHRIYIFFFENKHPQNEEILVKLFHFLMPDKKVYNAAYDDYLKAITEVEDTRVDNILMLLQSVGGDKFWGRSAKESIVYMLHKVGHKRKVFDTYISILESETASLSVKEMVLTKVFQTPYKIPTVDVRKHFSKEQCEAALAASLHLSLTTEDISLSADARRVLYYFRNPLAKNWIKAILNDKSRTWKGEKGKDARNSLFTALSNMGDDIAGKTIIDRLAKKKTDYWNLGNSLGNFQKNHRPVAFKALHQRILQTVKSTKNTDMASNYLDGLLEFAYREESYTIELAEAVLTFQEDAEQNKLRYILEEALVAKIVLNDYQGFTELAKAMNTVKVEPFSNYKKARGKEQTTKLRGDTKMQKIVQQALDDTLKIKPQKKLSTKDFQALNLRKIKPVVQHFEKSVFGLLWQNREQEAFLYYTLYDGTFWVGLYQNKAIDFDILFNEKPYPLCRSKDYKNFFADWQIDGAKLMLEDPKITIDYRQSNEKVYIYMNRVYNEYNHSDALNIGLKFKNAAAAQTFLQDVQQHAVERPPIADRWYKKNAGMRATRYYAIKPTRALLPHDLEGGGEYGHYQLDMPKYVAPTPAQEKAFFEEELKIFQKGGMIGEYRIQEGYRTEEEISWHTYLRNTFYHLDENNTSLECLDRLKQLEGYVEKGVLEQLSPIFEGLTFHYGKAAKDEEIQHFEKQVGGIEEGLRALWKTHSSILLKNKRDEVVFQLLSPSEVLEDQVAFHEQLQDNPAILEKKSYRIAKNFSGITLIYLKETEESTPFQIIDFMDFEAEYSKKGFNHNFGLVLMRVFVYNELNTSLFQNVNLVTTPDNFEQKYLEDASGSATKFYRLIKDEACLYMVTNYGKVGTDGRVSRKNFATLEALNKAWNKTLDSKKKKGYDTVH